MIDKHLNIKSIDKEIIKNTNKSSFHIKILMVKWATKFYDKFISIV